MIRTYLIQFSVYSKAELDPDQTFKATAVSRGECPYEALFFLRDYLKDSEWVSLGEEVVSLSDEQTLQLNFPHMAGISDYVKKNGLLLEIESDSLEQAALALTA